MKINKKSGVSTASALIIIVIVIIIVGAGGYYFYLINTPSYVSKPANTSNTVNIPQNQNTISQNSAPAVNKPASTGPISMWSLEAHDQNNVRVSLCQKVSKDCAASVVNNTASQGTTVGGVNVQKFNNTISGSGETSLLSGQGALEYCANLSEGGYGDWRLPTIEEMSAEFKVFDASIDKSSMTYWRQFSPSYDKNLNKFHYAEYWSSSMAKDGLNAKEISMEDGRTFEVSSSNTNLVRCVR